MSVVSRGIVYSLIAIVCVLLVGITALLSVSNNRHQRLEDMTIDMQRNISQQEGQIKVLQQRLANCDTVNAVGPSWNARTPLDSTSVLSHSSRVPN